jgi:membrane associated rhomboid family serine protease
VLSFALSVLSWSAPSLFVVDNLVLNLVNLTSGRYWTIVASLFVHASPAHLIGNMCFLYVFGRTLERELGQARTLALFLSGGVSSSLLSLLVYPPNASIVGASGAIFTFTSVTMLTKPLKFSILFLLPQGLVAILYFLYNLAALQYHMESPVAHIAHVIGFLMGIPFGIRWSRRWKRNLTMTILLLVAYGLLGSLLGIID